MTDTFLDELLAMPQVYYGQRSPDGTKIAVVMANVHDTVDVFLTDAEGSELQPLTHTEENTVLYGWFPDSTTLLVGHDRDGNERVQLFTVSIEHPNSLEPVTEQNPQFFLYSLSIHPDGTSLVFAANYDTEAKAEMDKTAIIWHDLKTQERKTLTTTAKPSHSHVSLNKGGTHILYSRQDREPGGIQYWLYDLESDTDTEILSFAETAQVQAAWLAEGDRIVFTTDRVQEQLQDYNSAGIYDINSGTIEWLVDGTEASCQTSFAFGPRYSHHIALLEIENGDTQCRLIDSATYEQVPLPEHVGTLIPFVPLSDDRWLGMYDSATQPGALAVFPLAGDGSITDIVNPLSLSSLSTETFTDAQSLSWQSTDGIEIHGWVFQPQNTNGKTIVYIHGGPTAHIEREFIDEIQYYCHRGFSVFVPNYRGSTGYGNHFREAIKTEGWGGQEQEDIFSGIDALIERGLATPGQVGVTGGSYGGYSSWFAITHASSDQVAAVAPVCGMTDLVVDYETTRPDLRPYSEEMMGGSPGERPQLYYERSPINFLDNITGRVLIVQGLQDPNVTPENVRTVEEKLQKAAVPYEKLAFEDEGHGIAKPENKKVLYRRIANFFEEAL